jgi:hypothetical protein
LAKALQARLLMIICRIYEYLWIEMVTNPITAVNYNAMCICLQESIIEDNVPLSLIHLSLAVCHKGIVGSFSSKVFCCKGLKVVWKLSNNKVSI